MYFVPDPHVSVASVHINDAPVSELKRLRVLRYVAEPFKEQSW